MIKLNGVFKSFGNTSAVDNVSCVIENPGVTVIMGPSGSGKTTFLRLIAGLEAPAKGEIFIDGKLVSSARFLMPAHKRGIGFVFQVPALWPHMTVKQNIAFGVTGRIDERVDFLIKATGLSGLAGRFPDELSGGQARRVSFCRAVAAKPKYLLLDEPFVNLDRTLKKQMLGFLKDPAVCVALHIIYVTHDIEEAAEASSVVMNFDNGRLQ